MKMEQTECSETLAYKIQTPGNYPECWLYCLFLCVLNICTVVGYTRIHWNTLLKLVLCYEPLTKQGCIILQTGGKTDVCLVESLYQKYLASTRMSGQDRFYCLYIVTKKEPPSFHVAYLQYFDGLKSPIKILGW